MRNVSDENPRRDGKKLPLRDAVGTVLAHDITEIRPGEFKGRAFKKGHVVRKEDLCHLQRLGKENLYVLDILEADMHEDEAALSLATALMGEGVKIAGEPREGKVNIVAARDGLLKIHKEALFEFNMVGDVICATMHNNMLVKQGQIVAGTRAIPLVVKRSIVDEAVRIAEKVQSAPVEGIRGQAGCGVRKRGVVEVKDIRKPKVGVVITGNEVYYGRIQDAFAQVIKKKINAIGGGIVGLYYAPDDETFIEERLRELLNAGADLLITTGGMSVDPDDVTRFAIRKFGAREITYGAPVLPGSMFLVAYAGDLPILGIPACGMYADTTIFDLVLVRILTGERIGRKELAELAHGGLCLKCEVCRYPVCPFGK